MSNVTPLHPRSIQGEQQELDLFMNQGDVDAYVEKASERVNACRERGRHLYPPLRPSTPLVFIDITEDGLFVRELECTCCGCAVKVELWEAYKVSGQYRYRHVANAAPKYKTNSDGDEYLAPSGRGRMTARQVRESLGSMAMAGISPTKVQKEILAKKAQLAKKAKPSGRRATQSDDLAPMSRVG